MAAKRTKGPAERLFVGRSSTGQRGDFNMMQVSDMPIGMMWGMGLVWLLVIIFILLGIAALIKYLRS
jgi:hypothetical protein